jgi:hypothetical protein
MDEEVDGINDPNDKRNLIACLILLVIRCQGISEIAYTNNAETIYYEIKNIHIRFLLGI